MLLEYAEFGMLLNNNHPIAYPNSFDIKGLICKFDRKQWQSAIMKSSHFMVK